MYENRSTTSFDPLAYLQANPDVAAAYNNDLTQATLHYITHGYNESRSPALGVDPLPLPTYDDSNASIISGSSMVILSSL